MITDFPVDWNPVTYDIHTTDGTLWSIIEADDGFLLTAGDRTLPLMKLEGRFTFFASGYDNINVKGFSINGVDYVIDAVIPNSNYTPPPVPSTGENEATAEFQDACQQFRTVCLQIGTAIGNPNFRGGFDEMVVYGQSAFSNTLMGLKLALAWNGANELCKYTGGKIGLGQPQWWYTCWEVEQ